MLLLEVNTILRGKKSWSAFSDQSQLTVNGWFPCFVHLHGHLNTYWASNAYRFPRAFTGHRYYFEGALKDQRFKKGGGRVSLCWGLLFLFVWDPNWGEKNVTCWLRAVQQDRPGLVFWAYHTQALWPWTCHLTSLTRSFPLCETGIMYLLYRLILRTEQENKAFSRESY